MSDFDNLIQALDEKLAQTDNPIEMANIYHQAGILFADNEEVDEACFFMTQAFVLASHYNEKTIVQSSREFLRQYNRI